MGVDQGAHIILYIQKVPPTGLAGEVKMNRDPLRIIVDNPIHQLSPLYSVNLRQPVRVDHEVKVKSLGMVERGDLVKLLYYIDQTEILNPSSNIANNGTKGETKGETIGETKGEGWTMDGDQNESRQIVNQSQNTDNDQIGHQEKKDLEQGSEQEVEEKSESEHEDANEKRRRRRAERAQRLLRRPSFS